MIIAVVMFMTAVIDGHTVWIRWTDKTLTMEECNIMRPIMEEWARDQRHWINVHARCLNQ